MDSSCTTIRKPTTEAMVIRCCHARAIQQDARFFILLLSLVLVCAIRDRRQHEILRHCRVVFERTTPAGIVDMIMRFLLFPCAASDQSISMFASGAAGCRRLPTTYYSLLTYLQGPARGAPRTEGRSDRRKTPEARCGDGKGCFLQLLCLHVHEWSEVAVQHMQARLLASPLKHKACDPEHHQQV